MSLFKPNKIEEVKPGLFVQSNNKGKYRQVYPITKDPSKPFGKGNINWKNIFRIDWNLIILIVLIIILVLSYKHDLNEFNKVISNPCVQQYAYHCYNNTDALNVNINWTAIIDK